MQQHSRSSPLSLFSVVAPEDLPLLTQWETHLHPLAQAGLLSFWSERHLAPGADRAQEIQRQCETADLIVLLLSADFFASPDCCAIMEQALARAQTGTVRVLPLLLRAVAWQESALSTFVPWPPNGIPITGWSDPDAAWDACVQEVRRLLGRRVSQLRASPSTQKQMDRDWERMLRRLRRSYKELLDQSLHGIAWMELGLATQHNLVSNATNLLFRLPDGGERILPSRTKIVDAYDEAEEELLILGAPGAGKSTLLLDLAQQLVDRALANPDHPLPVILRLSSWALQRPPLEDWIVEQVSKTYDVPRQLSERWVKQGHLLPLLDGLDEVEEAARSACIAVINRYHRTQMTPLVVCSRQVEYEGAALRERLVLQSAVIVQPLSNEQIEGYLSTTSPAFAGVRAALSQELAIRELATTPLMLSVLLLTYRGVSASEITRRGSALEQQVWTDYVARQVAEKGYGTRYSLERTHAMLSWLAQQMRTHQQAIFYAEYIQSDWLTNDLQRIVTQLTTRIPALLLGGCVSLLIFPFIVGSYGYTNLVQMGLLGGFAGGCLSWGTATGPDRHLSQRKLFHLSAAVLLGALLALSYGLSLHPPQPNIPGSGYFLRDWIRDGSILSLGSVPSIWIFQQLLYRTPSNPKRKMHVYPSWQKGLTMWFIKIAPVPVWQAAMVLGIGMGLSIGLLYRPSDGPVYGLSIGVIVVLIHSVFAGSIGPPRFVERFHWTWHGLLQTKHLRASLSIVGALSLLFGLTVELNNGLRGGLSSGLRDGLISGLSGGLSFGFSYWIVLGLYRGMKQEHLKDQTRQQFNQGIRRSLRSGLLIGLISALIIGTISILQTTLTDMLNTTLRSGLRFWLSSEPNNFPVELTFQLRFIWIWLPAAIVVMWALSGGLTILRHYVIRWLLAGHRIFPFRAQAFLDDATSRILLRRVGGGYSFIHRRLQDYFADAAVTQPGPGPRYRQNRTEA